MYFKFETKESELNVRTVYTQNTSCKHNILKRGQTWVNLCDNI